MVMMIVLPLLLFDCVLFLLNVVLADIVDEGNCVDGFDRCYYNNDDYA